MAPAALLTGQGGHGDQDRDRMQVGRLDRGQVQLPVCGPLACRWSLFQRLLEVFQVLMIAYHPGML